MEWWQTLLMTGGSVFVTLLVTFIFNWVTNRPKKKKEEREKEQAQRKKELQELKGEIQESIEEVKSERIRERLACEKDHVSLMGMVVDIQNCNKAQNIGLQAVLKDLLKIRYLEWLDKGFAPMDARDDLERMYQAYHNLGANGVMDSLRSRFLELPEYKKQGRKKVEQDNDENK